MSWRSATDSVNYFFCHFKAVITKILFDVYNSENNFLLTSHLRMAEPLSSSQWNISSDHLKINIPVEVVLM